MSKNVRLSRLNPVYLAYRHAGVFLFLLALGIAGGLVYQAVATPRTYESEYQRPFAVVPPAAAAGFDWDAKLRGWTALIANRQDRILMTANLRAAVKKSAAASLLDSDSSPERLRNELLSFRSPRTYSTSPIARRFLPYVGPSITVARHDLAVNLDFQSLARIVTDLDPKQGTTGWDLASYAEGLAELASVDRIIVEPGPDDPYFRVLYRLHALLNGGTAAATPGEAWLTAVEEVGARIVREFEFQGGGGFGETARKELLLETAAMPILAANGLYYVAGSLYGDAVAAEADLSLWDMRWLAETRLRLEHDGAARGRLGVAMQTQLQPFSFPIDTPMTRIAPLAVRTVFAFIEASERNRDDVSIPEPRVEPSSPAPPVAAPPPPEPAPSAEAAKKAARAEAEAKARSLRLAKLEADAHQARIRRDECLRRLEAARIAADQAAAEAFSSRDRADRLKERLDAVEFAQTQAEPPPPNPEYLLLLDEREGLLRYLAVLLQTCTDEHPFVVQARRELTAIESRMALCQPAAPDAGAARDQTRLLNLKGEWTAAANAADSLAERLKRRRAEAERRLAELSDAEKAVADLEFALAAEKPVAAPEAGEAVKAINQNIEKLADRLADIASERKTPSPIEMKPEQPAASERPQPQAAARVSFSSLPDSIPLARLAPSPLPVLIGAAVGLCLALAWVLLREILTFRLTDPFVARRLVDLPLLAVLPAYDGKSFAEAAAKAGGGKLAVREGRRVYVPDNIEQREPPPLGKRKQVRMRRRRRRLLVWILAALILAFGLAVHQAVAQGWLTPTPPFASEVWHESPPGPPVQPREGEL